MDKLKSIVKKYIDDYVNNPIHDLIDIDIITHLNFPTIIILIKTTTDEILKDGLAFDKNLIQNLNDKEKELYRSVLEEYIKTGKENTDIIKIFKNHNSKKHLTFYAIRELNWALISIMSASYISANILMRSILELLINISTSNRESVGTRINNINFLNEDEKRKVKKYWKILNSWTHPYDHWINSFCPIYISHNPEYNKKYCEQSLDYLIFLTDFFITIGIEKFKISKSIYNDKFIYDKNIFKLELLENRLI